MGFLLAEEKIPQKIIELANSTFVKWCTEPIIVKAVKDENAKNKSLEKIKEMDKKWQATPGIDDFMKSLMESECGKYLRDLQNKNSFLDEIFVMDNKGGNVAMTDKTSDFWQGDEDKFIKSFNKGKGEVYIGEIQFDDSSQAYLVKVSVPVKDGEKTIGVMTLGVNLDKIEQ